MRKLKANVNSEKSITGTMDQARERYNLGHCTIRKLADECDATLKIGKSVRYDFQKLDAYILSFREIGRAHV